MRIEFFPIPISIGLSLLLLFLAMDYYKHQDTAKLFFKAMFGLYLLVLLGGTLFPMPKPALLGGSYPVQSLSSIVERINWTPIGINGLLTLPQGVLSFDLAVNVLLTVPFGLGLPLVSPLRGRWMVILAFVPGLVIETSQLLLSLWLRVAYRGVDINDVLMNGLGVLSGYVIFLVFTALYASVIGWLNLQPKGVFAYFYLKARFHSRRRSMD